MTDIKEIYDDNGKFLRNDFYENDELIGQSWYNPETNNFTIHTGTGYWHNDYGFIKVQNYLRHCEDGPAESYCGIKCYCLMGDYVESEFDRWCKTNGCEYNDENFSIFALEYKIKYFKRG